MKKTMLVLIMAAVLVCSFGTAAYAKNFSISYVLIPNGPSVYSGDGYKVDTETRCYITTEGGTVITTGQTYKMRGKEKVTTSGSVSYVSATGMGTYTTAITKRTLNYIEPYKTQIQNGQYGNKTFTLAASLHSGSASSYTLTGKWNP